MKLGRVGNGEAVSWPVVCKHECWGVKTDKIYSGSLVVVFILVSLVMEVSEVFWELIAWLILVAPLFFLIPGCLCTSQLCQSLGGVKPKFCVVPQKAVESGCPVHPPFPRRVTLSSWKVLSLLNSTGLGDGVIQAR